MNLSGQYVESVLNSKWLGLLFPTFIKLVINLCKKIDAAKKPSDL